MRDYEELLGADYVEHNVHRHGLDLTRAVSVIGDQHEDILRGHVPVGKNKVGSVVSWVVTGHSALLQGHMDYLETTYADLPSMLKNRHNKVGVVIDVQRAWNVDGQEELQMKMMNQS